MFFHREDTEEMLGVWVKTGDCVTFSGELRLKWTHGVYRVWNDAGESSEVLSHKSPWVARVVLNLRHGVVSDEDCHAWYKHFAASYPMETVDPKIAVVLKRLEQKYGPFTPSGDAGTGNSGPAEEVLDVSLQALGFESNSGRRWIKSAVTKQWNPHLVEVCSYLHMYTFKHISMSNSVVFVFAGVGGRTADDAPTGTAAG